MFTIEQSGVITKTNTIDGLINEYIKRYVDNYVITSGVSSTITKEHLNELKTDLETKIKNAINDIDLSGYALKTDIKELPNDLINEKQLTTKLSEINDKIDSLATKRVKRTLSLTFRTSNGTESILEYPLVAEVISDTLFISFAVIESELMTLFNLTSDDAILMYSSELAGYIKVDLINESNNWYMIFLKSDLTSSSLEGEDNLSFKLNNDGTIKFYSQFRNPYNSKIYIDDVSSSSAKIIPRVAHKVCRVDRNMISTLSQIELMNINRGTKIEFADDFNGYDILSLNSSFITNYEINIDFSNFDASCVVDLYRMMYQSRRISGKVVFSPQTHNTVAKTFKQAFNNCVYITEFDLSGFYLDSSTLTSMELCFTNCQSAVSINVSNIDLSDEKINVNNMFTDCKKLNVLYIKDNSFERIKSQLRTTFTKCDYKGAVCYLADDFISTIDATDYTVLSGTTANTTITHYCPIDETMNDINDFIVGAPVYMTGKVYKYTNDGWQASTSNDTTDCICSVKTSGSWKEYVGICVRIDETSNCITFASAGDYMVKVGDSSCYSVGDEVFIDNEDNKLKVLSGETAITSKIRRMTVGIITGIVDGKTLSVFK